MTAELAVTKKALAAVCGDVREGGTADFLGAGAPGAAAGAHGVGTPAAAGRGGPSGGAVLVAAPASAAEAAALMRVAAEHELAVVPRGGGSRLGWGTPPSRCDLVIDMSRMSGVVEHAAGDLVARVQPGARMADVAGVLAQAGQEIALDVPGAASVGGVVASGLAGPRRLRYGTPRDLLIGITIVRADGTVAKSGGKVVKNVAGYDLGKLFAGSAGTLGLITEATFRLHPLPAARAFVTAEYVAVSVACDAVAAAANSPLVASAVELTRAAPGGPVQVGVLLEGSADGVAARSARMAGLLGKGEVSADPPDWWPGAAGAGAAGAGTGTGPGTGTGTGAGTGTGTWIGAGAGETLIAVSFWVAALPRVLDAIEATAAADGLSPVTAGPAGAGLLYVRVAADAASGPTAPPGASVAGNGASEPGGSRAVAGFVSGLRAAVSGPRGAVSVLTAPAAVRGQLAGHGGLNGAVPGLALMRAVKDQFDPGHRMAPGRFPEAR